MSCPAGVEVGNSIKSLIILRDFRSKLLFEETSGYYKRTVSRRNLFLLVRGHVSARTTNSGGGEGEFNGVYDYFTVARLSSLRVDFAADERTTCVYRAETCPPDLINYLIAGRDRETVRLNFALVPVSFVLPRNPYLTNHVTSVLVRWPRCSVPIPVVR